MKNSNYDYLIVGAGLFGLTIGRLLTDSGCNCLIIDKRGVIGGNCYTEKINGINVHKYGPHIFHTNNIVVETFIKKYTDINNFSCRPKIHVNDKVYSFPINLMTMNQLWGIKTPNEAEKVMFEKTKKYKEMFKIPKNAEEQALYTVGYELYSMFYKEYLKKQWGLEPIDISPDIIKRQVFRTNYDDNYYYDNFQGIPDYNKLFKNLSKGIEVLTNINFIENKSELQGIAKKTIYTGQIDEYFEYKFKPLEYRSLRFEEEYLNIKDFQGTFMVSYPESKYNFTRIIEHKHFEFGEQNYTIITKEYPQTWNIGLEPFYPINNQENNEKYNKYIKEVNHNIIFAGRMGSYKYINMDETINNAIKLYNKLTNHE